MSGMMAPFTPWMARMAVPTTAEMMKDFILMSDGIELDDWHEFSCCLRVVAGKTLGVRGRKHTTGIGRCSYLVFEDEIDGFLTKL